MGKRQWIIMGIILGMVLSLSPAFANIDNLSNVSVEWIRTGNRNAATDATDIVVYNPAGLTDLSDGVHLSIGNQVLIREPTHSFDLGTGKKQYEQDSPDFFLPSFYGSYNKDNWSVYFGIYIPGGGATADYPDGSITTQLTGMSILASPADPALAGFGISAMGDIYNGFTNESLEATSIYLTPTLGGSYKVNEKISVSAGIRYIKADNTNKAQLTLSDLSPTAQAINAALPGTLPENTTLVVDSETTADGLGGIIGVNWNLTEKTNFGLTYQTKVRLDFETKVNRDDIGMYTNGEKNRRDFPAFLGMGLGHDFSDRLYGEVNGSYWFQTDADWGKDTATGRDISEMAGNAWSMGGTMSYKIRPTLLISLGATYTKFDWKDIDGYYNANIGSYEVLYTDNWHIGSGVAWEFKKGMKLNVALARTFWDDQTIYQNVGGASVPVKTENATTIIAFGFDFSF